MTEDDALEEVGDALFRRLFDSMPQLGWTARADGFIDFYNRGWFDYTGTTYEQMQGWGWKTVHDPTLVDAVTAQWQSSISSGSDFEMEFPLRRHDGTFRWFLTRVTPLRDADGSITRWVGINTDVDDIRAAKALGAEITEQNRDVEKVLTELRDAKEQAERRITELEAEIAALGSHSQQQP